MTQDEQHLRILSIFHYVAAGLAALFALFPVFHLIFGLLFILIPHAFEGQGGPPPPTFLGWIFVIPAALIILCGWAFAALVAVTGYFLGQRRHHLFCLVMAGVECVFFPFGTAVGVFSIIVLTRESVQEMFGR